MASVPLDIPRQAGEFVRSARESAGLTRAQLAKRSGVSERLIASLELGDATGIRLDKLLAVLHATGLALSVTGDGLSDAGSQAPAAGRIAPAAEAPQAAGTSSPAQPTCSTFEPESPSASHRAAATASGSEAAPSPNSSPTASPGSATSPWGRGVLTTSDRKMLVQAARRRAQAKGQVLRCDDALLSANAYEDALAEFLSEGTDDWVANHDRA